MSATLDIRQRFADRVEALQAALDGRQAQLHTGMPGQIVSYNPATMTAVVQPSLQAFQTLPDGTVQLVTIRPIEDVPVHFPGGGGFTLTFPVKPGDDCWIKFSERSLDNWYQHGGVQQPSDWRMHDITDAVAEVGVRSQPKVPGNVSGTTTQLRSDDGTMVVDMNPANATMTLTAPTQIVLDTPSVTVTGVINVENKEGLTNVGVFNGILRATVDVFAATVSLFAHQNQDVQPGGSLSGPPQP
jgi:hypothetical protein